MDYDLEYDDYGDLHDECVSRDEVVSYVIENHWDEVEEFFRDSQTAEWLAESKPCLGLLSTVSQRDRAHMRSGIKKWFRKKPTNKDEITDEQLFAIASDVSAFIEELSNSTPGPKSLSFSGLDSYQRIHKPTAARSILASASRCALGDDLEWANHLIVVTRAFRDFLSETGEADITEAYLPLRIRGPIEVFNSYVRKAPAHLLVHWRDTDGSISFARSPQPETSDLASFAANWISDYLANHYPNVGLGVCAECGKFFLRERRDKTFCSKTCQNRVAYKRKKLLESDALAPITIEPENAHEISRGLCVHHPRFGIGIVEALSSSVAKQVPLLPKSTTDVETVRHKAMLSRQIAVQVRFLHGPRILRYSDLFEGEKKEDQLPTFYEVKSEETLAELL